MNNNDLKKLIFDATVLRYIQKERNIRYFSDPPNISQLETAFTEILIPYTWMVYSDDFCNYETAKKEGMEAYLNDTKFYAFINTAAACFIEKAEIYTRKWIEFSKK